MTKFVAVALLVLLALAGLPLAMDGGEMMACPSCPSAHFPNIFSICLAVLAIVVAFSLAILGSVTISPANLSSVFVTSGPFKPPRAT